MRLTNGGRWYQFLELYVYGSNAILWYRNINDVDKTMEEINEQTENMKLIQEALSTPLGAVDFDEVLFQISHN